MKTSASNQLPVPHDFPERDIVIYDSHCGFCRNAATRISRWDLGNKLAFLSSHDQSLTSRFPALPTERLQQEMLLVDSRGRHHWGVEAWQYLSRKLIALWPLALLLHVPGSRFLWNRIYRLVAANRYWLSSRCADGTCSR